MSPNPTAFCEEESEVVMLSDVESFIKISDVEPESLPEKYVWTLSEELAKIAKKELGEDQLVRESSLVKLRTWVKSQPHLSTCRTDNLFLLRFLRSQKFKFEKTCKVLENYVRMRCENPEWFGNLDPTLPKVTEMCNSGFSVVLPGRDVSGRRVLLSCATAFDLNRHTNADIMKVMMAAIETLMDDEENQIRGITYVFYCKDLSFAHCAIWTPAEASRLFGTCEKNLGVRHSDINLVRLPLAMWAVVEFVKQFLSAKIKSRIHSHNDERKMLASPKFRVEDFPPEVGGSGMSVSKMGELWRRELVANRDKLMALDEMIVRGGQKTTTTVEVVEVKKSNSGIWSFIPGL